MAVSLITTKLYIPPAPLRLVTRSRLIERLEEGITRKLTLLSASAGFGKTTLLSEWIHARKPLVAWISLDEGDSNPARFLSYLIAALETIQADVGQATRSMLQSPQPPPIESVLATLINGIAALPQDFALVLDDYHVIHVQPIHTALAFLLDNLPPRMHLILSTRADPPLPLARLRARGQLTEIRAADLRFTPDEATAFLNQVMGLNLSQEDVAALETRTEGWIAGLQLAALSMRGRDDVRQFVESFTGSNRYILDYLIEEVFRRQPEHIQTFLLQTSILDRLTAPLCDAVMQVGSNQWTVGNKTADHYPLPPSHSQEILEYLESANLFIVSLDESRQWYRYHHLFADLLRHRLQTVEARDAAPLHKRASAWYEARGLPADAVHHALAAQDWERAAALIDRVSGAMLRGGEIITLLDWFKKLPGEVIYAQPSLCLSYSWSLLLAGQLDAGESLLKRAEQLAQDDPVLRGGIAMAQAYLARARGDMQHSLELSHRAWSLLPETDLEARSVIGVNLGLAYWHAGQMTEAEQALRMAHRAALGSGNHYARVTVEIFLGRVAAVRGQLRQAATLFQRTIAEDKSLPIVLVSYLDLCALHCEWNELQVAAEHFRQGMEMSQRSGNAEFQAAALLVQARLEMARGDFAASFDAIQKSCDLVHDKNLSAQILGGCAACAVEVALAQGDLAAAEQRAKQVTEHVDSHPFYRFLGLTRARLLIAQNQKSAAAEELQRCFETADRSGWRYGLLAVRVLQSLAAPTRARALEFLTEALGMAQPEGFIRTFAGAGTALMPLLQDVALQGTMPEYVGRIMAAIQSKASVTTPGALVEPLSEREIQVLRLMAAGLSNRAIAKKLVISLGTVKTHIHNIFSKLDALNRTQAVGRARELRLF